jgi:hypothetical protein
MSDSTLTQPQVHSVQVDNYYVSNNKRLFRVVDIVSDESMALLENCVTLGVEWLQFDVIAQMKQVTPSE